VFPVEPTTFAATDCFRYLAAEEEVVAEEGAEEAHVC